MVPPRTFFNELALSIVKLYIGEPWMPHALPFILPLSLAHPLRVAAWP